MTWRSSLAVCVLLFGLTQMAGDLVGSRLLKGVGAVSVIAPCPKVFCDMDGLEAFASEFTITTAGDQPTVFVITPELYSRLKGPYNRRNVYGAAIAAAPRLPKSLCQSVLTYGFAPGGPLRKALPLPEESEKIYLNLRTKTRGRNETWTFECTQ